MGKIIKKLVVVNNMLLYYIIKNFNIEEIEAGFPKHFKDIEPIGNDSDFLNDDLRIYYRYGQK